jgi:hypothetical protein
VSLRARVERLTDAMEARQRVQCVPVILDLAVTPAWAQPLPDGRCVRIIGGQHPVHRRRVLRALEKGVEPPPGTIVLDYRPGAAEAIRLAVDPSTPDEIAGFGTRGDGKTWAMLGAILVHADLQRERGFSFPVRWLGLTDFYTSHRLRTLRSIEAPAFGGIWATRDDRHVIVLTVDGVELALIDLVGVEDQGALDRLRLETVGLWLGEPAPAAVMETSAGVSLDAWMLARTSQRLPSYKRPALIDSNYPDDDHWTWQRFVVRKHPGTAYVRITPGERASAEDRAKWEQALEGRPDLQRRLLQGEPGVVAEGPQVAVGYRSDLHVSAERLEPSHHVPLILGHDGGLTPSTIIGQAVSGEIRVLAALSSQRAGTRQHVENLVRPWLAVHAAWALGRGGLLRHFYDPSMDTADQSDLDANPVRVIREVLGGSTRPGAVAWPARRDPMLAVLNRLNPATGRPVLQLDPVEAALLDRALSGRFHYPVVRGQVSRDLPDKTHPWSDIGDAFCYFIGGIAPGRLEREIDHDAPTIYVKGGLHYEGRRT